MSTDTFMRVIEIGMPCLVAFLGWIAASLHGIHKDLRSFVLKEDCRREMEGHCNEIDDLWTEVRKTQSDLSAVQSKVEVYHQK